MIINVGLIGAGKGSNGYGIGEYVAREVLNNSNCCLAAIMDSSLSNAESAVAAVNRRADVNNKFKGSIYSVNEKNDFFSRDDLELIIICSPAETHYEYIECALQNGKNVLTEKPFLQCDNLTVQEKKKCALEFVSVASRSGLMLSTNCQRVGIARVLNSKFQCSTKPNSINVCLKIKASDGRLESFDKFYDLLIAHPLSILLKYGVKNIKDMTINNFSNNEMETFREMRINGSYNFGDREMNFDLMIGQYIDSSSTSLQIEIDNMGPIDIQMAMTDSHELMTKYTLRQKDHDQIEYSEDLLKIIIGSVVDSIIYGTKPLIDNDETYLIYALQEDLKDRLKI